MKQVIFFLFSCFLIIQVSGQQPGVFAPGGTAIDGYDVVAFFTESKPVKGTGMYSHKYQDATWLFSNKENLEAFTSMPAKYAPQYGGWCAYGISQGHKSPTQPGTWTIVDGKLYFNYNNKVKQLWIKDQAHLIEVADQEWPKINLTKK